ncbi:non-ribosomal peptide synthetase, partial [Tahibacter aquaticus]|uniref:non-ribosomal peptide synthetase n=1 Tax=Tahibacter aquaticus TaxID=520092 RepID=UPI00105E76B5
PLLSPGERAQVVQAFNDTAADLGAEALVHQLFEAQAAREPAAAALRFEGEQLSYAQLNARANQLAHRLLALGVKPDDRVAVCMQRSVELVVALLAVLKAGAAYVPLDPDYPSDRLAYLLGDCTPVAVLTQGEIAGLPLLQASTLPLLLADSAALDGQPEHNPQVAGLGPHHLAYVIYTSGSTGQPKGVMNEHAGVVNRLRWAQSQFALSAADRVLQKTPYSFDVSVWEFFLPLLAGACLVVARPQGHQDPAYLIELIDGEGITLAHFVPSMLQVFIDQADAVRCRSLRQVKCSGEALPYAAQQRFAQVLPQAQLYNLYGPTEAAVDVTWWRCDGSVHAGIVPIGRPVANTQMYVLDAQRQPVPVGVTGELYIGGIQVARGYIGRAQLTAERFVADPFSAVPNARLYKTGDLGRWLADGSIEYLGRNDFQVKIRGFRIELGEIEAA